MKPKILGLLLAFSAVHVASATVITPVNLTSIDQDLQSRITIQQSNNTGGSVQVRYTTANSRSAIQTFTWNSSETLGGLGLLLYHPTQAVNVNQAYELRFFEVTGIAGGSTITSTLETYEFTLTPSLAAAGSYLYFELPAPLVLNNGGAYMFQLAAVEQTNNAILYLARSSDTNPYAGGSGFQLQSQNPPAAVPGVQQWDYTFFLSTPVPEPTGFGLLGVATLGMLWLHRRRQSRV